MAEIVAPDLGSTSTQLDFEPGQGERELLARMPDMVKGAGFARKAGRLEPLPDGEEVDDRSLRVAKSIMQATKRGFSDPAGVAKGFSPGFMSGLSGFLQSNPQQMAMNSLVGQLRNVLSAELQKDITLTSPLTSGLVPFDLVAP